MSEKHSTAKMTTIFAMPSEGGVEVPMVCPCCDDKLNARHVYDGTERQDHGHLPLAHVYIPCRACVFSADLRISEDRISITWGGGER